MVRQAHPAITTLVSDLARTRPAKVVPVAGID